MPKFKMTEAQKSQLIYQLALDVNLNHDDHPDVDMLVSKPDLLRDYVKRSVNIWKRVADAMNVPQNHIYHWYNETYIRRMFNTDVAKNDVETMRKYILGAILKNGKVERSLRRKVFDTMNHYEKPIFDKAYNQCLSMCKQYVRGHRSGMALSLSMPITEKRSNNHVPLHTKSLERGKNLSHPSGIFDMNIFRNAPQMRDDLALVSSEHSHQNQSLHAQTMQLLMSQASGNFQLFSPLMQMNHNSAQKQTMQSFSGGGMPAPIPPSMNTSGFSQSGQYVFSDPSAYNIHSSANMQSSLSDTATPTLASLNVNAMLASSANSHFSHQPQAGVSPILQNKNLEQLIKGNQPEPAVSITFNSMFPHAN